MTDIRIDIVFFCSKHRVIKFVDLLASDIINLMIKRLSKLQE